MRNKKKKGFTLVEMMAVIAIIGIFSSLIFSLFSSTTSMLVMAENDNELQNQSRNIIDVLEEDIRYGKDIEIGAIATDSVLKLERKGKIYKYEVEGGEFKQYVGEKPTDSSQSIAYTLNVSPSKYIKEFKVEKQSAGEGILYKLDIEFENGKSNYKYSNSIYPMNG